ncbi:MAG: hypothetical protein A3A80_04215 [Candidatus Terrybacteria bacterium RIFCSPLOWO2_01_FULL_44_24]|nr:MAG: hypothetical protein A3A80_04215 [Candidatus Terrybacteria bacterium RIFCSPLOWO2_01_FULL_44_24]
MPKLNLNGTGFAKFFLVLSWVMGIAIMYTLPANIAAPSNPVGVGMGIALIGSFIAAVIAFVAWIDAK